MGQDYDVTVIGGGVVGMATAMALSNRTDLSMVVLEAEDHLAAHQTGHNSGVIHSGIYYKPGSLKAKNCVEGREAMYRFCEKYNIAHDRCGKVIVALTDAELPQLDNLEKRGKANGLVDIRRLTATEVKDLEPHASGLGGIHVPYTGIVDYKQVVATYGKIVQEAGCEIRTSSRVTKVERSTGNFILQTAKGEIQTRAIINCGGLQSDRIARMCGVDPKLQIIPFRGEYYEIVKEKEHLVRNLVYPVPDPRFPFLGVHFTRMIAGGIEAGPNAVLAFKREGYEFGDISIPDLFQYGTYLGFWKMVLKFWKTGIGEMYRSLNKAAFVSALQKLIPEIENKDIHRSGSGVRAQALAPNGALLDDFAIEEDDHMIHVLNAPSPAATASISIGETIAGMAIKNFGLRVK
jgi:(S)-2-hydroxyglutarate dehydrogenase